MLQQNSRRIALLVVCLLIICGSVAFAGWLRLTVHSPVDLGTIDAGSFVGVTPPVFDPLTSSGSVSTQLIGGCPGSQGRLQVQLYSASDNVDITRFMWRGGAQQAYTTFQALYDWMDVATVKTVKTVNGRNWDHTFKMSYRYDPTENDRQGDYYVRLRFRLRLYVYQWNGGRRLDWIIYQEYPCTVRLSWNALSWIVLHIPTVDMSVFLGTITPDLFDPATGTWTPLTSGTKSAWVIANVGFTLTVTAESATGFMPADLTRFKMIGGDLTTFTPLDVERTLATSTIGGLHWIRDIQYQYIPCWRDALGLYKVTVTYTVTAR